MKLVHIVVGEDAANKIRETINKEELEEIFILKDLLNFGFLKTEQLSFSEGRTAFWEEIGDSSKKAIDDLGRLMGVSTRLSNNEDLRLWFWMAGNAIDICAYYWLIHFLKKHQGKLSVINISGLPFIDDQGKLFYAESISDLPLKEMTKARKLVREILPAEWEADGEEWKNNVEENAGLRIYKGGKAIQAVDMDYYDEELNKAVSIENAKENKVIQQVVVKHKIRNAEPFLRWRIAKRFE